MAQELQCELVLQSDSLIQSTDDGFIPEAARSEKAHNNGDGKVVAEAWIKKVRSPLGIKGNWIKDCIILLIYGCWFLTPGRIVRLIDLRLSGWIMSEIRLFGNNNKLLGLRNYCPHH